MTVAAPRALAHADGRFPAADPRRHLLAQLDRLRAAAADDNQIAAQAVAQFARGLDPTCLKVQVPSFARELRDLPALAELGDRLCARRTAA